MYFRPSSGSVRSEGSRKADQSSCHRFILIAGRLFASGTDESSCARASAPPSATATRAMASGDCMARVSQPRLVAAHSMRREAVDLGDVAARKLDEGGGAVVLRGGLAQHLHACSACLGEGGVEIGDLVARQLPSERIRQIGGAG